MNLKLILMELGNKLVTEHGYYPAGYREIPNTTVIKDFTDFLNKSEKARTELKQMGLDWEVMKEIPFYCPICNCETAVLLGDVLFANPYLPTLQCTECKQLWRINLYPVGEEEE